MKTGDKKHVIIISLIILILVASTPFFIPYKAMNIEQIEKIQLGLPINFITQYTSLTPDNEEFPIYITLMSPWENPIQFKLTNFIFSYIITWIVFFVIVNLVQYIWLKTHSNSDIEGIIK